MGIRLSVNSVYRGMSLCIVSALAACSGTPSISQPAMPALTSAAHAPRASSAVADVTLKNASNHDVEFHVDWRYPYSPIWLPAGHSCVKPGEEWHTSVDFNYPERKPNIQFRAYDNCNVINPYWIGIGAGNIFENGDKVAFTARYVSFHYFCLKKNGGREFCAA